MKGLFWFLFWADFWVVTISGKNNVQHVMTRASSSQLLYFLYTASLELAVPAIFMRERESPLFLSPLKRKEKRGTIGEGLWLGPPLYTQIAGMCTVLWGAVYGV